MDSPGRTRLIATTGFLSSFSTDSTFALESLQAPPSLLVANVFASYALGFGGVEGELLLLIGIGACCSFTTFPAFSYETVRLWETGRQFRAIGKLASNFLGAFAALGLALLVVKAL